MGKLIHTLLTPLVALALMLAPNTAAFATPRGDTFYVGAANPTELAEVIEASCRSPGGQSGMLRVLPHDAGDVAHARPIDWFNASKQINPRAQLRNVCEDLPRLLRSLVQADAPEGQGRVWSACITPSGYILHCGVRAPHAGEKIWVDPQTAVAMFLRDCSNPIEGPEFPNRCYVFNFDYYEQRDVKWFETTAGTFSVTTIHMSLSDEEMRRMYADDCYFAEDGTERYKPRPDCPFLFCPPGSTWPTIALARAVGLPDEEPNIAIHAWFQNGRGRLSVPLWAARILAREHGEFIPCVYVQPYFVSVQGFQRWTAFARLDRARGPQIQPTLSVGHYSEVFRGRVRY